MKWFLPAPYIFIRFSCHSRMQLAQTVKCCRGGQTDEDGKSNKALAWAMMDGWRGQERGHDLPGSVTKNSLVGVDTIYKIISIHRSKRGAQAIVIIGEDTGNLTNVEDCPQKWMYPFPFLPWMPQWCWAWSCDLPCPVGCFKYIHNDL